MILCADSEALLLDYIPKNVDLCLILFRFILLKLKPSGGLDNPNLDQASDKTLQLDLVQVHLLTELLSEKMASYASRRGEKGGAAAATEEVAEMTTFDTKLTGFDAK